MRRLHRTLGPILLASCSTAFGCREEDLPPLRWESERTVIGSRLNGLELCADDLALLDEHVGFVEDMLGVKRQAKVEVYFYDFDELPCSVSPQGCYRRDTDQIHMATWDGVDHELVHAIARDLRFSSLFWDEGVAEALRWTGTLRTETDTLQNAWETSSPELDYMNARHFVRWFVESFGAEDLRRVAEGLSGGGGGDGDDQHQPGGQQHGKGLVGHDRIPSPESCGWRVEIRARH